MSHWFHRNPLKATARQDFDVRKVSMKSDFSGIVGDLRQARRNLLSTFTDPTATIDSMLQATEKYFSLLQGLINAPSTPVAAAASSKKKTEDGKEVTTEEESQDQVVPVGGEDSKLKSFFRFKWSQSLWITKPPISQNDAEFELINMGINVGIWFTKHASRLADNAEISMDDAKEVHKSLRIAAGIFKDFKENRVGRLVTECDRTSDCDARILDCYITCSQAEAQEVTLARAVEMKHSNGLIASLASSTADFFQRADNHVKALDQQVVLKWRKYLQLKQAFYRSYAYCYHGETLLAQEKCGDAIKCLMESQALSDKCHALCKEYMATKGAGSTVRPHEHNFYKKLIKQVHVTLEKLKRENGFIYFQKIPEIVPEMNLKSTYGLAEPEAYTFPEMSSLWTPTIYAGFNVSKNVENKKKETKTGKKDPDVIPVKEPDIKVTKGSECVIS